MTKRGSFPDKFKAMVALGAFRGGRTAQEIAAKRKVHLLPTGHACPSGDAGGDLEEAGNRRADGGIFR